MDAEELRSLWEAAGGAGERPPSGAGLFGLPLTDDLAALTGAALVALGLPLNGDPAWPREVRAASRVYADWLPAAGRQPASGRLRRRGGRRRRPGRRLHAGRTSGWPTSSPPARRRSSWAATRSSACRCSRCSPASCAAASAWSRSRRSSRSLPSRCTRPDRAGRERWSSVCSRRPTSCSSAGATPRPTRPRAPCSRSSAPRRSPWRTSCATACARSRRRLWRSPPPATEAVYVSVDLGVVAGLGDPVGLEARELVAGVRVVSAALLAAADICGGRAAGSAAGAARVAAEIAAGVARRLS